MLSIYCEKKLDRLNNLETKSGSTRNINEGVIFQAELASIFQIAPDKQISYLQTTCMNYPFLYHVVDRIELVQFRKSLHYTEFEFQVWQDWVLKEVQSDILDLIISTHFSHLKIYKNKKFISIGSICNFHIDRFHVHHLLHRVLIPLDDNFHYEWILNQKKYTYQPKVGEIILFNNMVPHRFVINNKTNQSPTREVIYFDLYDPLTESYLSVLDGNYSKENAIFEKLTT